MGSIGKLVRDAFPIVAGTLIFAVAVVFASQRDKAREEVDLLKAQAVQRGHAEYRPDEHGFMLWRWKEAKR